MAEKTRISWCDSTFNPFIGCTKVGPGCDACYAEALDKRMRYGKATHWGAGVPRLRTGAANWKQPLRWNRRQEEMILSAQLNRTEPPPPWRVFCASLADVFDNEVPTQWRIDLIELINKTPNLSWLLVTKRIGNVARMIEDCDERWIKHGFPDHVRLLITVCNQEEADRDIPKLLALPCRNGISYEPALGPVNWGPYLTREHLFRLLPNFRDPMGGVQWIIVGGESSQGGAKARPFDLAWARSTMEQCKVAGVAAFFKQAGSNPVLDGATLKLRNRSGADLSELPVDLQIQEFPNGA